MILRALIFTLVATPLISAEPDELIKLRGSYQSAIAKATSPIRQTYATELEKLKAEFINSGNLEATAAVEAELQTLVAYQNRTTPGDKDGAGMRLVNMNTTDEFAAWLLTTTWKNTFGSTIIFPEPGRVEITTPTQVLGCDITISQIGRITWKYSSGASETLVVAADLRSFIGDNTGKFIRVKVNALQTPTSAGAKDGAGLRLVNLSTTEEFAAWLLTTTWKNPSGSTIVFPEQGRIEITTRTQVLGCDITIPKPGRIAWHYSTGASETLVVAGDLRSSICDNLGKFIRVEPKQ